MLTDARERVWMQVNAQICQSLEIDTIFSNAALAVRHMLNTDQVAIFQLEPISDGLQGTFVAEDVAPELESFVALETCDRNNVALQNLKGFLSAYCVNGQGVSDSNSGLLSITDTLKAKDKPNLCAILWCLKICAGLMIPLIQQGKTRGLLCIYQYGRSRQWQPDEILFATQVALQLSLALQQNELRQQVQWQSETIETQSQQLEWVSRQERASAYINACIQQVLDIEQIFAAVTLSVQQLLQVDRVAIYRFASQDSSGQGQFIAENVVPDCDALLAIQAQHCSAEGNDIVSLCSYGGHYINRVEQSHGISTADTALDSLSPMQWQLLNRLQVKAELVFPLKQGERLWGLLCLHQCCRPRDWQPAEVECISRIAIQLSVAIQQAALYSQVQVQASNLQGTLIELQSQQEQTPHAIDPLRAEMSLLRQLSQVFPSDSVFTEVLQEVRHLLGCDRIVMYRFFPDWSGEFLYESVAAHLNAWVSPDTTATWSDTCLQSHQGGYFQAQESAVVGDVYQMHYQPCHLAQLESRHIRAFIVVPIVKGERLWGLLGAYCNATPKQWNPWQVQLLETVGMQLGQLLQKVTLVQQLQQAQEAAALAYRSKRVFLAKMSHELRTPLNAILGFSQLLRKDPTLNTSHRETLNTIYQGGVELLDLVNNLLALSALEAGNNLPHHLGAFNLCAFLNTLYDSFLPRAKAKGLELSFVYDVAANQHIQADEEKLRQVFVNLLSNAIKFTEAGQVSMHVRLQQFSPQTSIAPTSTIDCLSFAIEDTGIGFTDAQLETVRDPVSSLSQDAGTTGGVGLGLTLSRDFIQIMGGEISIESEGGRGTTVRCHVPVQSTNSVGQTQWPRRRVLGLVAEQPHYRVLIVEQDSEHRQNMACLLSETGFNVKVVDSVEQATLLWQTWCPHLVWLDWQPLSPQGFNFVQHIRTFETTQVRGEHGGYLRTSKTLDLGMPPTTAFCSSNETVVIAMIADGFEDTCQATLSAGCNNCISKPTQEAAVFQMMATHLGARYLYDNPPRLHLSSSLRVLSTQEIEQQMSQMTDSWLATFLQAAINLDEETLAQHVEAIADDFSSLASELNGRLKQLQLDRLIDLAQRALALKLAVNL